MQKLAEVCIKRPVFATMLVMAFVVIGAASWFRLGVDRFPAVDLPTVNVRVELPGASSEEMESLVSQRLEEQINTIQGIQELRSISGTGATIIIVTFALSRQIDVAAQDVRDKVAIAVRNLPREISPPVVSKFDNDQAPVVTIALSGDRTLRELTEIADKLVRPHLERSTGVGEVRIVGGLPRAVSVWVDPDRLAAYQIPITSVRDAIVRQNADLPGGNVTAGLNEASLRTMGRIVEPKDFNDLVLATLSGVPVRVRDIGYAEESDHSKRDGSGGETCGRRGITRRDERERAGHAGDARVHHRNADCSALPGATGQRAPADTEGHPNNHAFKECGAGIDQPGTNRRMGVSLARNRASQAYARRVHAGHSRPHEGHRRQGQGFSSRRTHARHRTVRAVSEVWLPYRRAVQEFHVHQ